MYSPDQSVVVRQPIADLVVQPNNQSFALTFIKNVMARHSVVLYDSALNWVDQLIGQSSVRFAGGLAGQ